MKRFERLEFEDPIEGKVSHSTGEQLRDAHFFYKRAKKMELSGDFEAALRNYSKSVEENINFIDSWEGQILILIEMAEYREAEIWSDKALDVFPANPGLLAAKALAYFRDAYLDKALAFSDNAISKSNITPNVWLVRAEIMANKKMAIAENCIEKALNISGNKKGQTLLAAGRVLIRYKKYISANQKLTEATTLLPKSPLVWLELGKARYLGKCGDGVQAFEHCLTLRENWPLAESWLAKTKRRGFFRKITVFK